MRPAVAATLVVAATLLAACGGPDRTAGGAGSFPSASSTSAAPSRSATPAPSATATGTADETGAAEVVAGYYAALQAKDGAGAYALLCFQQQTVLTAAAFDAEVQADVAAGTGIASWTPDGTVSIDGDTAVVGGAVALDQGGSYPIKVGLLREETGFKICATDLGGILPGPGAGAADPSATAATV